MIKKIYLDMDGVLCNFERRYFELYNELPGSMRDRKQFNVHWDDFIATKQFETLDWYSGGKELVKFCSELDIPIELLSSSGGMKYHTEVERQKCVWLDKNGMFSISHVWQYLEKITMLQISKICSMQTFQSLI